MHTSNFSKTNCSCGYGLEDFQIKHRCEYSTFGKVLYWIGISAIPVRVNFVCSVCDEIIESSNEPHIVKKFVGR